jgi:hypothetical protein
MLQVDTLPSTILYASLIRQLRSGDDGVDPDSL